MKTQENQTARAEMTTKRKVEWFAVYCDTSWFSIPLRGLRMRRFNLFSFYDLGACVAPLRLVGSLDKDLARDVLYAAKRRVSPIYSEEKFASLKIASKAMIEIDLDIDEALKELDKRGGVAEEDCQRLTKNVANFEAVLKAESPNEYTYVIDQLRGYSMPILVDRAELNFSPQTINAIGKEVAEDISQAGRCLAFELPTAAGIHMMRAFEKVFRRFYNASMGKDSGTTDIYKLIKDLRDHSTVDPKILNVLDQIRDLHRNPLAHEVFLDTDEVVDLFHIAESAITAMAKKL